MKKDEKRRDVRLPDFLAAPSKAPPSSTSLARMAPVVWAGAAVVVVMLGYFFCLGGGQFGQLQTRSWGYSLLADGFMQGHTYLTVTPPAGLLALADPYDPVQNFAYPGRDKSLFDGHFYYYFGPIPAMMLVLAKSCLDSPATIIGDQFLVLFFMAGLLAAIAMSIVRWRRVCFPEAPAWTVAPAIVGVAMSLPLTWLAANPAMLEATVAGGQCFLLLGLYFAMSALKAREPGWVNACAAGGFWALACGCRLSLGAAIAAIALLTLVELRGRGGNRRTLNQWGKSAAAMMIPLVAAAIGLLIYDHARFGSWTETGWNYQLAYMNHHALAGKGIIISPRYIPSNLYRYLIELPKLSGSFPFLVIQSGAHGLVRLFPPPPGYAYVLEQTAGILWSAPFCLLAIGLLPASRHETSTTICPPSPSAQAAHDLLGWLTRCLAAICALAMAPVLCMIVSVERYLADGATAMLLLAVLGAWRLLDRARGKPLRRRRVMAAIVFLSAMTAIFGILLLFAPRE